MGMTEFVGGWGPRREDGKQECERCGKVQWAVIHSCAGVPKTDAARERYRAARQER